MKSDIKKYLPTRKKRVTVSIRFPDDLKYQLQDLADDLKCSFNKVVIAALRKALTTKH